MNTKKPTINRIIIGDVGSGKTIVAFLIGLVFQKQLQDCEISLLAPTEVLAYQHYQNFLDFQKSLPSKLQKHFPASIYQAAKKYYINGEKFTKKKFEKALEEINQNKFWIGTHALLHSDYVKPNLIFIDEQHRFGVRQRNKLIATNNKNPHFISLTATPIPRTLALTLYESLQPHFLETLSSRRGIQTSQQTFENFDSQVIPFIKQELGKNRKVFIICPSIEEAEDDELWSTTKTSRYLKKHFGEQVLTVHGKNKEKKNILQKFKESEDKNILVATTVVEVGVDVPQASLMIVLNSERFGLSALHQMRGRVGRNDFEDNYCILVTYEKFRYIKRLQYLKELNSGFDLAEKDLQLRGSGDMLGKIQSGFGNEIDEIIGLDKEVYNQISQTVSDLDLKNIDHLQRLKKYLEKEAKTIHHE